MVAPAPGCHKLAVSARVRGEPCRRVVPGIVVALRVVGEIVGLGTFVLDVDGRSAGACAHRIAHGGTAQERINKARPIRRRRSRWDP